MMTRRFWFALTLTPMLLALAAAPARAEYPDRPIKLIMPYAPGGIIDFTGRKVAQYLAEALGQPVVAENHPGAGGMLGTGLVAHGTPDGYTIVIMDPAIVINPTLQPSVPYDLFKQLVTVSIVTSSPEVFVVAPQLPIKSVPEFIAYAKANPGKLNYGSAGVGTTPHLAAALFQQLTGIDTVHVPYRGIGQIFPDMMSNKIQFAFSSIAGALPFTQDNRIRAIATTGLKRAAVYPDLPTVAEAGVKGFSVDLWLGIFAPAATPPDVLAKLNAAINDKVLKNPDFKTAVAKFGIEPRGTTLAEGAATLKDEYEMWKKVVAEANIKLQ
ncbi:MAG TPA: tripartite tricarboxylate transporter substrate binding protein [Xanthobacteraceae bacterium]|nr:tripartite tricarboxylate transporter substrate binding protein [Xanthobacteraceae bacterium]